MLRSKQNKVIADFKNIFLVPFDLSSQITQNEDFKLVFLNTLDF